MRLGLMTLPCSSGWVGLRQLNQLGRIFRADNASMSDNCFDLHTQRGPTCIKVNIGNWAHPSKEKNARQSSGYPDRIYRR